MDKHQNPQLTARLLISMASTEATMHFVACAIQQYFLRITQASTKKLVRHGLRPIIAPMVAEASLQRVEDVNYSAAWLHALIADDVETAELAWRAVTFYADMYADMELAELQNEIGNGALKIKDTARLLTICVN